MSTATELNDSNTGAANSRMPARRKIHDRFARALMQRAGSPEFGMFGVTTCALGGEITPFGSVNETFLGREGIEAYFETSHASIAG